jgi:UDP-N-acetylmuramoyl-tripeptide--D-alanyl-D-alanine ligase
MTHANLTPEFVHENIGFNTVLGQDGHPGPASFTFVTTDSRKIEPGCLFVALEGEKFDGHDFIPQAIEMGATGVICRRGTPAAPQKELQIFMVENTLQAYRRLAAAWRKEFSIPVIAIAGSVGKTTTKEMLSAILRGRWPEVLRTQGSQNGYVGIPMTLLEIRPQHGAAVIEVGIDEIGAMEQHMPLVHATVSVLTSIAPEHLEKLIDLPTVAKEEGIALTSVADTGGAVAINLDDPWIRPHFETIKSTKKIGYTLIMEGSAIAKLPPGALVGRLTPDNKIEVTGIGGASATFTPPLPGRHNAGNLLAALAVAHTLGLNAEEIRRGLATFSGAEGRSELRELKGPTPVVCDYYNASPASMEAGFQLLTDISKAKHSPTRWACLGDMLELGAGEEGYHRGLANSLMSLQIEHILLYGPRMQALQQELKARGYPGTLSHHSLHEELAQILLQKARPGDAILIKGSRGMRMEEVWKTLSEKWTQA